MQAYASMLCHSQRGGAGALNVLPTAAWATPAVPAYPCYVPLHWEPQRQGLRVTHLLTSECL